MDYATEASLRYTVSSLSGFSLSGTPDTGTFNPLLLRVDTPTIRFAINPTQSDDSCNTHSRQAFHDLVQLVGLTLYVDFADNPSDCHSKDPQVPAGSKHASLASPVKRIAALLAGNLADVQTADAISGDVPSTYLKFVGGSSVVRGIAQRLGVAIYFFGAASGDCKALILAG